MTKSYLIGWLAIATLCLVACAESPAPAEPKSIAMENLTPNDHGKKLFYTKCASCHMVNKDMTGPALKGVLERWPDQEKLYAFIRNSEDVIRNDKYARELWLEWNQTQMLPHPDLTDADIAAILDYVAQVSR